MLKSAGKVGLAVMASRILGLMRDQIFAGLFGGGRLNDAFQMAFRIPNLLRDLFAEGALSSAFVTVFARHRARGGDAASWNLARLTMTFQCLVLGVIVLLGILFAPWIVHLIAPGFANEPGKMELTVLMTRILFPFILLVGMASLTMGVLNAYGRFGLPASASSFFNLGSILLGVGLALIFDPSFGEKAIVCMAIGSLGGGALQWLVQVPALRKLGYRYRFTWDPEDPGLREILKLMAPAVIGVSAVQVNVVINSIFASGLGDGAVSWLAFAFRLIQLPIGLFGVAIATASLPSLAVHAAHHDPSAFRGKIEQALRLNAALCIPSACGLAILSVPLVSALFERGKFDSHATLMTAQALSAYAVGLIGYASIKILAPAFYALNRTLVPMIVSIVSIAVTVCLNWLLVMKLHSGPAGLALATSFSALFSGAILLAAITRLVGPLARATWHAFARILLASVGMSAVIALLDRGLIEMLPPHGFVSSLTRVVLGVATGAATYLLLVRQLGLSEAHEIERAILRRFSRKKS